MQKIVLAEDDKLISSALIESLKQAGYDAIPAYDGEEALEKIRSEKPDLVLLDIMMPKLDGIGVVWEVKADKDISGTAIMMLTNMGDPSTVSKIVEAGITDYLLKSEQSIEQIIEKVKEVLNRKS